MYKTTDWLYGFSTTIKERINILKESFPFDDNLSSLNKWCSRKTLLTDKDFNIMLKEMHVTKKEFDLGVSELTESKLKILYEYVKKQRWYKIHQKLFSTKNIPDISFELATALRFHLNYYRQYVNKYIKSSSIHLTSSAVDDITNILKNDLLSIANSTFVWDVHDIKKYLKTTNESPEEEFKKYIEFRFASVESTKRFFSEYPALSRILATRLLYALDNIKFFIDSISQSLNMINSTFSISSPYTITHIEGKNSDSHNNGKSTLIFILNNQKLVFKYHNNDIQIFYNNFLQYIENFGSDFYLYRLKCITAINYCIEEYIPYESCTTIEDIELYYTKYGMLIGIAHWFGCTDLHMENLIAYKNNPVLVDIETFLMVEEQRIYSKNLTKAQLAERNSAIVSGLLPMHKYWKRQLDVSALNGVQQKLPFKVRRLLNENSSNIMYELQEGFLNPAQNIPLLNNVPVTFQNFSSHIITGYIKIMEILLSHKNNLLCYCLNHLQNQYIRVLLRDTQDYSNFLSFSTHPSCMLDFIEHEKVLLNLWNHSFFCNKMIPYEINALTYGDIPYFYTPVSSLHLYQNNKDIIYNYFKTSAKDLFISRIRQLQHKQINLSTLLIRESTNTLKYETIKVIISPSYTHKSKFLSLALSIKDIILNNIIMTQNKNYILWPEITIDKNSMSPALFFPDTNFYNGSSGIYVFLYALKYYTKCQISILDILEKEIFYDNVSYTNISAFYGYGARVLTSFILYKLTKEDKFYTYIIMNIRNIINHSSFQNTSEWLNGSSSFLCLLAEILNNFNLPEAYTLAKKIINAYTPETFHSFGFAHGYSGVLLGLLRINYHIKSQELDEHIHMIFNKINSFSPDNISPSWCNGTLGINRALKTYASCFPELLAFDQLRLKKETYNLKSSCICHGTYAYISELIEKFTFGEINNSLYQEHVLQFMQHTLLFDSASSIIPLGMFTGISGIGYQLLRLHDPSLVDVLFFE